MSKPWGNIGAWAAEAERAEEEERQAEAAVAASASAAPADTQSFPSLKEAVNTKPKKKKMSLTEFYSGGPGSGSGSGLSAIGSTRLTPDEMLRLPTAPRERSAEEMQYGRLGGGFSSYGRAGGYPSHRSRDEPGDASWGSGGRKGHGLFDEERRGPPPRSSDFDQPSRADEVDNWAMAKKPLPSFDSGRQNRYGSLGGSTMGGGMSRADEVDNWAVGKKAPSAYSARSSSFGSGFRDSGPEPDRWTRGGSSFREERPRLVLDPPKGNAGLVESVKTNKPNPFGEARPREQVLAEKGLDWKKLDSDIEAKKATSRPTSAHSSRPSSAHSCLSETQVVQGAENAVKARPKVNPFGDAKPREVLLEEKGLDWRKIDFELEHRRVDRSETEEEKMLKAEIDCLKKEIEKESTAKSGGESVQGFAGDQLSKQEILQQKERELETLIRDLDDKVRFGSKTTERPGSGAGRASAFSERPPSQSGSLDESRSAEFMDRPRSRGRAADTWTRPGDERRASHSGRDRGFLSNRDMARSRSRERW